MTTSAGKLADKIMALVDEFPSEPFSFERKQLVDKLEYVISRHSEEIDEEFDVSFQIGLDEGLRQGSEVIDKLKAKLSEAKENVSDKIHEAYRRGYLAGSSTDKGGQID